MVESRRFRWSVVARLTMIGGIRSSRTRRSAPWFAHGSFNSTSSSKLQKIFFVANYAASKSPQDGLRQPDVAFCFMSGATLEKNVPVGCTDTLSSTRHCYCIFLCFYTLFGIKLKFLELQNFDPRDRCWEAYIMSQPSHYRRKVRCCIRT
jgi:hypothetical protein